jgi:hypothetical protein
MRMDLFDIKRGGYCGRYMENGFKEEIILD